MAEPILVPQLGMAMTEATIVRWCVQDGAAVKRGEPLLEIETEKVSHTIEAPADGVVRQVAAAGETLKVQAVVGYLAAAGEPVLGPVGGRVPAVQADRKQTAGVAAPAEVRASPIAKRLAAQHGLDLETIAGTGPGGRIVEADVLAALQRAATPATPASPNVLRRLPFAGRRKVIAERMLSSLATSAQLTITREVDASTLVRVRERWLRHAPALGVRITYDAIFAKVLATALKARPELNARSEGEEIVIFADVHVAVAVATEAGLLTPVLHNADSRSLLELAASLAELTTEARAGTLVPDRLAGGTVTLTNLGLYKVDAFTPILNPPQAAILGLGSIAPRPVVADGCLSARPTVHLSLTWDHRIADGVPAALLLDHVATLITDRKFLEGLIAECPREGDTENV